MPMPRIKRSPMSHQILGAKAQPIAQAPAPEPQPHKYVCGRPYRNLAEQQRTNRRSQQGSGIHQAFLEFARVPYWFHQRHYYANDEEIVGVGKESHPEINMIFQCWPEIFASSISEKSETAVVSTAASGIEPLFNCGLDGRIIGKALLTDY
jgi:hypothetical protein